MNAYRLLQVLVVLSLVSWTSLVLALCAAADWLPWWPACTLLLGSWALGFGCFLAWVTQLNDFPEEDVT